MAVSPDKSPWTQDRQQLLRELVGTTFSCQWLAAEINSQTGGTFTKNAVISKVHRMGLTKANTKIRSTQNRPKTERKRQSYRPILVSKEVIQDNLPPADFIGVPWGEAVDTQTCMYPEGDGQHMLFCGQPRKDDSSYCSTHHKICFVKANIPIKSYWRA